MDAVAVLDFGGCLFVAFIILWRGCGWFLARVFVAWRPHRPESGEASRAAAGFESELGTVVSLPQHVVWPLLSPAEAAELCVAPREFFVSARPPLFAALLAVSANLPPQQPFVWQFLVVAAAALAVVASELLQEACVREEGGWRTPSRLHQLHQVATGLDERAELPRHEPVPALRQGQHTPADNLDVDSGKRVVGSQKVS